MPNSAAAELRVRAAEARRIANNLVNSQAQMELRQMADALEAEANKLESGEVQNQMPPPTNGH